MRRTVAMIALTLVALLSSGCASVSGANFLGLNTSGGNASADSEYPTPAAPVILIPRSHYSAFTIIDPNNGPQKVSTSVWLLLVKTTEPPRLNHHRIVS